MHHCPRCLKLTDGVHTCTPTEAWREMELTITNLRQQIAYALAQGREPAGEASPGATGYATDGTGD